MAVEPTVCEVLSVAGFEAMRDSAPNAYNAIFRAVARSLASRLRATTREVQSLEE